VKFLNKDRLPLAAEVDGLEVQLGRRFPLPLRRLFLENNGGEPDPCVYQDESLHTIVNGTLPLFTGSDRETAVEVYKDLALSRRRWNRAFSLLQWMLVV